MSYEWRPAGRTGGNSTWLPVRFQLLQSLVRATLYAGLASVSIALGLGLLAQNRSTPRPSETAQVSVGAPFQPTATPAALLGSLFPTSIPMTDVAIVAGHWSRLDGSAGMIPDPGSVCPDGTREVDINLSVARQALALLEKMRYRVVLFEEFDSRLKSSQRGEIPDFRSRVFFSIHSDACVTGADYPLATGFKIAHAQPSDNQAEDDRLVRCVRQPYERTVDPYGLKWNENTITSAMTAYHGFREIVSSTPAAIIELGFLGRDREILTQHQPELAHAISDGIDLFLRGKSCEGSPTPPPQP